MSRSVAGGGEEEEEEEGEEEEEVAAAVAGATSSPRPPPVQAPLKTAPQLPGSPRRLEIARSDASAFSLPALAALLLLLEQPSGEPHESELTTAAQARRATTSLARARGRPEGEAAWPPTPGAAQEEEATGSSGGGGPLLAAAAVAAAAAAPAFALPLPRSFDGVFAVDDVRSDIALLRLFAAATETEGDAEGRMLQVLPPPPGPPPPPPRCGVEWPESGMEQEGGAELGASGGRLEVEEEEVEAATPPGCCGDADDVVEVDASVVLSIPPLLAPRRCVAVVAVPIRQDADPPSEKERNDRMREEKR